MYISWLQSLRDISEILWNVGQIPLQYMRRHVKILKRTIEQIREAGVKVGVSIKPATPVNDISHMLSDVDMVLIMTVQPGFGGQKYMEECTEKIREVRELIEAEDLDVDVQVDGGINDETMETVLTAGANLLGSRFLCFQR